MLTAKTKTGKTLCLGYDYKKETLFALRKKEEFICPDCGESVVLKLGDQRIFHFAHKQGSTCRVIYENESYEHLEGKRQLFQWLIRQKVPSVLEYYDREIQQRPDILFRHNGKKYALEYQCSTLPEHVFTKRTKTYLENDYIPLWIIAASHIHPKRNETLSLSNFHYSFIRSSSTGILYIPAYCPVKHLFQLVESITPFSIKNTFAHQSYFPSDKIDLDALLEPNPVKKIQVTLSNWNTENERYILNRVLHPQSDQKMLLREMYSHGINPFLLPPEIGLPVTHSVLIQTPPIIWQMYIFLDVLANKKPNDELTIQEISSHFNKRIQRNNIKLRALPQVADIKPILPVIEYLQTLQSLGILTRKGSLVFQVQRKLILPKSNREREEIKRLFLQKNNMLLSKNK
ncbi:competence protein CoiA family protein [Neobacillus sp. OS1-2]|uniref:competence protein CoiA n=1 Tax=Neobacillus sp. OS1-2 TaxID=3070680 RepID=UPI0027DFF969|nr:competence protein CoiA family protein [Neobacillus sp. OS1-2]WML38799.1 competence protein CoiA family protein [Neobacillus sp. OS1-2]